MRTDPFAADTAVRQKMFARPRARPRARARHLRQRARASTREEGSERRKDERRRRKHEGAGRGRAREEEGPKRGGPRHSGEGGGLPEMAASSALRAGWMCLFSSLKEPCLKLVVLGPGSQDLLWDLRSQGSRPIDRPSRRTRQHCGWGGGTRGRQEGQTQEVEAGGYDCEPQSSYMSGAAARKWAASSSPLNPWLIPLPTAGAVAIAMTMKPWASAGTPRPPCCTAAGGPTAHPW